MAFKLRFTDEAAQNLKDLEINGSQQKRLKAVRKTLGYMETNLRHPSLQTHKYKSLTGPRGEEVFESYAENKTPGASRVFWYYGSERGTIVVVAIVPHP